MAKLPSTATRQTRVIPAAPDPEPLSLRCRSCDALLTFIDSIGGVGPIERWDRYVCRKCGTAFDYWPRTHSLERIG
jgi:hypothetical protein